MAAELPRPGVEVIQVFKSTNPTVITPTLVPCIVGVCRQIVDVLSTTATGGSALNTDAYVPLQACFVAKAATGTPKVYSGLDGLKLVLSLNHGPNVTITFTGAVLTPAQIVATVLAALATAHVTAFTAEEMASTFQWRLRSLAGNEFQNILVVGGLGGSDAAVLTAFGLGAQKLFTGSSAYAQSVTPIFEPSYPNPNRNLAQLVIEVDTVRAFLYMGTGTFLTEISKTQSFLRAAQATHAVRTGTADLTTLVYPTGAGSVDGLVLPLKIDGGATLTTTFVTPANAAGILAQINAVIGAVALATLTPTTNHLVITSLSTGLASSVQVLAGTALVLLGLTANTVVGTPAVFSVDDGNGDAVTPILRFPGQDFTAVATAAQITGTVDLTVHPGVDDGLTLILDDGTGPQTLSFLTATSAVLAVGQINGLYGAAAGGRVLATLTGGNLLVLTSTVTGDESTLRVVGGTALTQLGLTASTVATRGNPFPPRSGDLLYVDGVSYATVTQVAPGGVVTDLKIDRQVLISTSIGASFYIEATGLSTGLVGRPTPDLEVDGIGNLLIKNDLLRDTQGLPHTVQAQIFLAYHALREDVTSRAVSPALLRFSDTVGLGSVLAPISTDNPLALGVYFALLNSPGTQVTALGVDEATGAAPFGTVEAYIRAATFLEGYEVYAIAPLTHDNTVGQVFNTHVTLMSEPANKGERVVLFNPSIPTTKLDTLVASGTNGNSLQASNTFDTGIANLGALLLAKGISPVGPLAVAAGAFLDVGNGKRYSISSISGSIITCKTSAFLPGENDDGFYATTTLSGALIAQAFAFRVRGAALVLPDGSQDKDGTALTLQQMGQGYQNRRFWQVLPDQAAATLGGIEQVIDGFYVAAATAGAIGNQPPQQSFTNFPISGFTRVIHSNDTFTERQLNVMAAGGNYIIVQDAPATPLLARMALTTDMTSLETRTDSITKVVDFVAKFLRRGLKNFIGRFNITQGFLDSLGHVIQGLLGFLAESGTLIGSNLNNIVQDTSAPDTVLVDVTLDVPFPCNYIQLTLNI